MCCSAVSGSRFVRFVEAGQITYEEDGDELTGVFVKVAGHHSARHFASPEAIASLHLWVDSVPLGEPVLLAIICVAEEVLNEVLDALEPLGAPKDLPPPSFQAFAAVGVRDTMDADTGYQDSAEKFRQWHACHASSDVAYAGLPLSTA